MKINKEILAKSIIYRCLAFAFIFIVSMLLTQKIGSSILIGLAEFVCKTAGYYLYEHFWKWVKKTWTIK